MQQASRAQTWHLHVICRVEHYYNIAWVGQGRGLDRGRAGLRLHTDCVRTGNRQYMGSAPLRSVAGLWCVSGRIPTGQGFKVAGYRRSTSRDLTVHVKDLGVVESIWAGLTRSQAIWQSCLLASSVGISIAR